MLAQWARAWGADKVMLIDIDDAKIGFAKKQGFDLVFNSKTGDPSQWIKDVTGGRGADVAVEGAGVSQTFEQCLFCTRSFGKVVLMGNPAGEMKLSQKAYWEILRKQLKIAGTWNSSYVSLPKNDWALAIRSMETGKINVKPFITHRLPLSEGIKPFEMMRDRTEFYNKVMFIAE
jgi:L-iditol 2-dehydrogenase